MKSGGCTGPLKRSPFVCGQAHQAEQPAVDEASEVLGDGEVPAAGLVG